MENYYLSSATEELIEVNDNQCNMENINISVLTLKKIKVNDNLYGELLFQF